MHRRLAFFLIPSNTGRRFNEYEERSHITMVKVTLTIAKGVLRLNISVKKSPKH